MKALHSLALVSLVCLAHPAWAEDPIFLDVHLGDLQATDHSVLRSAFLPRITTSITIAENDVKVRIFERSRTQDLLESLRSTQVIGIVWIGHPALLYRPDEALNDTKILNSHLKSADGRYIPKKLFSAAHEGLQFISVVTCHTQDILKRYGLAPGGDRALYLPRNVFGSEDQDNALLTWTQIYSGPLEVLSLVEQNIDRHYKRFIASKRLRSPEVSSAVMIQIDYRDLISSHFDYEVTLNQKVVGILSKSAPSIINPSYKARARVMIFRSEFQASGNVLTIAPDDPKRAFYLSPQVVDDILIDHVAISDTATDARSLEIMGNPVHLGDDIESWDKAYNTSSISNFSDFSKSLPLQRFDIDLDRWLSGLTGTQHVF